MDAVGIVIAFYLRHWEALAEFNDLLGNTEVKANQHFTHMKELAKRPNASTIVQTLTSHLEDALLKFTDQLASLRRLSLFKRTSNGADVTYAYIQDFGGPAISPSGQC